MDMTYKPDGSPLDWLNVALTMLLSENDIDGLDISDEDRVVLACDCIFSYMQFAKTGKANLYHATKRSKDVAKMLYRASDKCSH